jgi:hypothetical protein
MRPRTGTGNGRIDRGTRHARIAKRALAAAAVGVFGAGLLLTRSTAAGHVKHREQPLVAPAAFVRAVRRNALQAGQIAPAQAPPTASTSQS